MAWKRVLGAIACALALPLALAQTYPAKPVKLVVPFPPGGATDVVARTLGQKLSEAWGQPVVVENRTGAGGNIGADVVAKAAPDGYTLLVASPAEIAINPHLYPQMPYDAAKDLVPVAQLATAPLVLVVHPSVPAKTVDDLIRLAKAQPAKINFASSGSGGPQHMAGELFKLLAKVDATHVPYKGGAPAITDLLGGQVQFFFAGVPPALPHIKSGRLRAIAVTTPRRSALLPELPTVAESGLPGFAIDNWQGLLAPAGTPPAVIAKLDADIAKVERDPEFAARLRALGAETVESSPAKFGAFIRSESEKYADIIRKSRARLD
jgi:tripartite-type tricarboxylate transporter receptor subunit TctC